MPLPNELLDDSVSILIHERVVDGDTVTYTVEASGRQRARTRALEPVTLNASVGTRAPEVRPSSGVPAAVTRYSSGTLVVAAGARTPDGSGTGALQREAAIKAARG